ncbi:uncharacterized protein LOC132640719 isoform X2 [Lycium barbarum]|uniref:uncharacterized protein LOC132640719 isoform X2 n=1 Tax=Lycium barbarum TaxID=112863 RepID=UPI00293ED0AC|nr:uncharacterized protein LOC132640719 isoform X2 [Lycium barbarum]
MDDSDDDMDEVNEMMPPPSKTQKRKTGTKGPMNLYYPQKPKEGAGDSLSNERSRKLLRDRVVGAFARWVYDAGLPFNCVNAKSFKKVIDYIGEYGPNMKPPTYHEVRVTCLKKEVEKVDEIVEEHKVQWSKFGCSIMMDKWTARNGKMVINVLVNSPKGSLFLGSYDASHSSTDSTKMYNLFERTIESIGKDNVVQVVTDNASENVKAGQTMHGTFPHIYWTPCAAHCINLIFGDIFKINPYASVFSKATKMYAYISQRPLLLNLMRKFTNERNLVRPGKTRFATAFLTLHSFYMQKKNLRSLVTSNEWKQSKHAKEIAGKEVARNIISPSFWNDVCKALKVGGPLIIVLRLVDGEKKLPMGYLYEAMDLCKESIAKAFGGDERRYEKVFKIIDKRWSDQLHRPLHAAGHILNPGLYYKNAAAETLDGEVWDDYISCLEKLVPDPNLRDKMSVELGKYRQADGTFGKESAIRARDRLSLDHILKQILPPGLEVPSSFETIVTLLI